MEPEVYRVHQVISEKTGLDINRVKKILAHGVTDWYKSILENALSVKHLDEATIVYKRFVKSALSIGQLPDSIPEGLRIFLNVVDLAARETGESRENILKVSRAMYCLESLLRTAED